MIIPSVNINIRRKLCQSGIVLIGVFLASVGPAFGQACTGASPNWTVTSGSFADIQACHNQGTIQPGDTITIPPGNYTIPLGARLDITKYVKINGTGATYLDNSCSGVCSGSDNVNLINITENAAGSTEFYGFYINRGSGIYYGSGNGLVMVRPTTNGKPVLFHDNTYAMATAYAGDFIQWRPAQGLIYRNTQTATLGGNCINSMAFLRHVTYGSGIGWSAPSIPWGAQDVDGNKMLYIEGNRVVNIFQAIDSDDNSLMSFRYNSWTNSAILTHGADTSSVGGVGFDIGNNRFIYDGSAQPGCVGHMGADSNGHIAWRNGTGLVHDNTIDAVGAGKPVAILFGMPLRRSNGSLGCWGTRTGPPLSTIDRFPYMAGTGPGSDIVIGPFRPWQGAVGSTTTRYMTAAPIYVWNNTGSGVTGSGSLTTPSIQDYPINLSGADSNGCGPQVATFDMLVGGSGYSNASNVDVSNASGGMGFGLTINITTSGGAVTGVTLNNGESERGFYYSVGDILTINGGNGDASFRVASVKWSPALGDLPYAAQYIRVGRDYLPDTPLPGYTRFTCPHPATGLTGTCDPTGTGPSAYNVPSGPHMVFAQQPTDTIINQAISPAVHVTLSNYALNALTLSIEPTGLCSLTVGAPNSLTVNASATGATFTGVVASSGSQPQVCRLRVHNNSDATMSDVLSDNFVVRPIPPTLLSLLQQPPTAIVTGGTLAPPIAGTINSTAMDELRASASSGCSVAGTTSTTASSAGAWSFTGLQLSAATPPVSCTLTISNFSNPAVPSITTNAVSVTPVVSGCNHTDLGSGIICTIGVDGVSTDNGNSASTPPFTSSGNLELIVTMWAQPSNLGCNIADNKNTVTYLSSYGTGTTYYDLGIRIAYVLNPVVGANHIISCTKSGPATFRPWVRVAAAFFQIPGDVGFDGASGGTMAPSSGPMTTPTVTPMHAPALLVGGCGGNNLGGFTTNGFGEMAGGANEGNQSLAAIVAALVSTSTAGASLSCRSEGDQGLPAVNGVMATGSGVVGAIAVFSSPNIVTPTLVFTQQPTNTVSGQNFNPPVRLDQPQPASARQRR